MTAETPRPSLRTNVRPPKAAVQPKLLRVHGCERIDPYYWLRERDDQAVIDYLEAENDYTDRVMEPTEDLQRDLVAEMRGRIKEQDSTAPYKHGRFYYYDRYEKGQEYPVYCRKLDLSGDEEILLDLNELATDFEYFDVGGFEVSPNHQLAAFGLDTTGRRFFDLRVLDLESGQFLDWQIDDVANNFVWAQDNNSLFFVKQHPQTLRWYQVHRLDLSTQESCLVYEEPDEAFELSLDLSLSEKFIFLESHSTLTSEVRYLPCDNPTQEPKLFLPRREGHEYFVTDGEDRFFVLTNWEAINFRLMEVPLTDTSQERWSQVLPSRPDVLLEDVEVFDEFLVLTEKEQGRGQMRVLHRQTLDEHFIPFRESVFSAEAGDNFEYRSNTIRIDYESMTTPETVLDYDMSLRQLKLVKQDVILGGFDPDDYGSEYIYGTAPDGQRVPISIVYRKSCRKAGGNPTLLYGYGAYGIPMEAEFDSNLLSLLDRGFVFAVAHVRGGAELGRQWYYDGRQLKKQNTFSDFIACSEFLLDSGITAPGKLFASGGSAGGLLMGAVINAAPHLYRGVYTRVPFVDVLTTMLDDSIPLTTGEYDEWGNPNDRVFHDYIHEYSPYDNLQPQQYPNLLVTTGLHDSQVQYWEPAKWVAKLRQVKTNDSVVLLRTDMHAGHGGKTGRFNALHDTALTYAFVLTLA